MTEPTAAGRSSSAAWAAALGGLAVLFLAATLPLTLLSGQLGDGSSGPDAVPSPTLISGLPSISAIAAGSNYSLALASVAGLAAIVVAIVAGLGREGRGKTFGTDGT